MTPCRGDRGDVYPCCVCGGTEHLQCTGSAAGHLDDLQPIEHIHFSSHSALFGVSQYEVEHIQSFPDQVAFVKREMGLSKKI